VFHRFLNSDQIVTINDFTMYIKQVRSNTKKINNLSPLQPRCMLRRVVCCLEISTPSILFLQKVCPGHFSKSFRLQGLHLRRTRNQTNCCVYYKEVLLYTWVHKRIFIPKIRDWSLETRCVLLLCSLPRGGTLRVDSDYDVW